jgi:hypothetical protein
VDDKPCEIAVNNRLLPREFADPVAAGVQALSVRAVDRGFQTHLGHEYLPLVYVVLYCGGTDLATG